MGLLMKSPQAMFRMQAWGKSLEPSIRAPSQAQLLPSALQLPAVVILLAKSLRLSQTAVGVSTQPLNALALSSILPDALAWMRIKRNRVVLLLLLLAAANARSGGASFLMR